MSGVELLGCVPVPKVDVIRLKPLQTPVNCHSDILGVIADLPLSVRPHLYTELCREEDLIRISV